MLLSLIYNKLFKLFWSIDDGTPCQTVLIIVLICPKIFWFVKNWLGEMLFEIYQEEHLAQAARA